MSHEDWRTWEIKRHGPMAQCRKSQRNRPGPSNHVSSSLYGPRLQEVDTDPTCPAQGGERTAVDLGRAGAVVGQEEIDWMSDMNSPGWIPPPTTVSTDHVMEWIRYFSNLKNTDLRLSKLCIVSPPATFSPSSLQVEHIMLLEAIDSIAICILRRKDAATTQCTITCVKRCFSLARIET
jgi:hypothetical protein